ncbi:hypothetical protein JCM8208_004163 [Rhodotorula glutinis]
MLVHESPTARNLRLEYLLLCDEHKPVEADAVLPEYLARLRTDLHDDYEEFPSVDLAEFWRAHEDAHGDNPSYTVYRLACYVYENALRRRANDARDHVAAQYGNLTRGNWPSSERKQLQAQLARLTASYKRALELYAALMSTRMLADFGASSRSRPLSSAQSPLTVLLHSCPLPVDKVTLAVYKAELAQRPREKSEEAHSLGARRAAGRGLMGRRAEGLYFG